ncbi:MBL fold metallo-hydrolase [Aquella oligotrophica]|uniref:MBL fold metallo-hydrolase n=2 Tax=Aquella oligotrophica TaxID=2067065 RepID=A0A2I7N8H9_9NEIS|nr:MBL fold metallo-hydrolase [Aquella oligotrophica]
MNGEKMLGDNSGIHTIDAHYVRDNLAAVYLIHEGNEAAIVETANLHSLPYVESMLADIGLDENSVKYIFLTHIHLDHAGGAGAYMAKFPHAKLVVHPRGARHMINPAVLEQSVIGVYGEDFVAKMYGKLQPIDQERLLVATDGFEIMLGNRQIICRHTPGHANHHIAIFDTKANAVFTGDVFGVCYPELINTSGERFIFPTTTPVNFDPDLMHQSINLIKNSGVDVFYPTHFGGVTNVVKYAEILHKMVDDFVVIAKACSDLPQTSEEICAKLDDYLWMKAQKFGIILDREQFRQSVGMDNQINAQGLMHWLSYC